MDSPVSCMITAGMDGMMIPNPTLSMNTDSNTKVRAAREELKYGSRLGCGRPRIVRHMSHAMLVSPLHPKAPTTRRTRHGPERTLAAGDRARAAAAALRRARVRRVPAALRQDFAHPVRPAAAHVAAAECGRRGAAGRVRAHL